MLLLLSSNTSRRYGDDIVRALAQPAGSSFQFRYGLRYVAPGVQIRARDGGLAGERCLIAFLNGDRASSTVTVTAVRAAVIARTQIVGSSFILILRAAHHVRPGTDAMLRAALAPSELKLIPEWKSATDAYPKGSFLIEITQDLDRRLAPAAGEEMKAFEEVAEALSAFPRFGAAEGRSFYAVGNLVDVGSPDRKVTAFAGRRYDLHSGRRYDLEVYSYSAHADDASNPATRLVIDSDEKAVRFTSSKELTLDSRYDLHRFTFTTDEQVSAVPAGLKLALSIGKGEKAERRCDITLETQFKGLWRRIWLRILMIAAGTALPAIIAVAYKDQMKWWIALIMFASAMIAGWGSVFPALRKS